jgi:hypothetical protein
MAGEPHERPDRSVGVVVSMPLRRGEATSEPWMSERALALQFEVSTRTVRRWRASGMPSRIFGGVRRYRLSECENWHALRESA